MSASHQPPGKFYVLAAVVIAVAIWMVMGAPASEHASARMAIARNNPGHR